MASDNPQVLIVEIPEATMQRLIDTGEPQEFRNHGVLANVQFTPDKCLRVILDKDWPVSEIQAMEDDDGD